MRVKIQDIAYYLPDQIITNEALNQAHPNWDMNLVSIRAGVEQRHIAREDETALDLGLKACQQLFSKNRQLHEQVDGLIFCTQSPDHIMPPNSCILHKHLDLPDHVLAFDINLACSGYIYGLALAQSLIISKMATNILLVTADTYSKYIHKQDRSARVLFGDGAAVSWMTASDSSQGIIDIQCATSGKDYEKFIIHAGGARRPISSETRIPETDPSGNVRTQENIVMDGMGVLVFVNSKIPPHIRAILEQNKLDIEEIDFFVFHQASKMALDSLTHLLEIKPEKVYQNLSRVGNTVSASIPIALKQAMEEGKVGPGDKVLQCGFGVGLSWGTAIMEL